MKHTNLRGLPQWCSISSVAQSCPTLCDPTDCSTPGFPVHHQLPELAQTHVHQVGDAIQPSHPLSSPSPPTFILSQPQGLFKWVSSSHHVAEVLEFQLQHQSFQWIFRTGFFRMDWLDLLAVQGTLKHLLQHHSSKASILQNSAFLMVQLSHRYMTTGKTVVLTRWTFVDKVISGGSDSKTSAYNAGDPGSIPGSGRSPGEGNGNPLQYSCLENPIDGGTWWAAVHAVAKSQTRLSDFTFTRFVLAFPGGASSKESASLIPGSGRSPGAGSDTPLQYSCLENSMAGYTRWGRR